MTKRYIRNWRKFSLYPSCRIIYETPLVIGFQLIFKDTSFDIYFRKKIYAHLVSFVRNYQKNFPDDKYCSDFINRLAQRSGINIKDSVYSEIDYLTYLNTRFLR